jgi:hypothetical protein
VRDATLARIKGGIRIRTKIWSEDLKGRDCLGDVGIDVNLCYEIVNWIHLAQIKV